MASSKGKMQ